MLNTIKETAKFLKDKLSKNYQVGIILGTGLGGLVNEIEIEHSFDYEEIPNFPVSTVEGHSGKLIFGKLGGKNVVALQGRFHYYEGYSMNEVVFPVRVMKFLGIKLLIVSNASGGVNPEFEIGEIMIMDDHINLFGDNPLIGKNMDELGPRFPDMSEPYERKMIDQALAIAKEEGIPCHEGVYAGVSGPNLETRAEYRFLGIIGADAVGMSTVPEVIVARQMDLPVFAVSAITDLCDPDNLEKAEISRILDAAFKAEKGMTKIIRGLIARQ